MYQVFRAKRKLKIFIAALVVLAGSYFAGPAISLYEGQQVGFEDLVGSYINGEDSIEIEPDKTGTMVCEEGTITFSFDYLRGTLSCKGEDSSWNIRCLGNDRVFNLYNKTILQKKGESIED